MGLGLDTKGTVFRQTLEEQQRNLKPGDVFVFYTDGVIESRGAEGEEYGYDRLLTAIRANRHEEVDDLHSALLSDLNGFVESNAYADDTTLVILKWHGSSYSLAQGGLEESRDEEKTAIDLSPSGVSDDTVPETSTTDKHSTSFH